jgi:hypothetical protein
MLHCLPFNDLQTSGSDSSFFVLIRSLATSLRPYGHAKYFDVDAKFEFDWRSNANFTVVINRPAVFECVWCT